MSSLSCTPTWAAAAPPRSGVVRAFEGGCHHRTDRIWLHVTRASRGRRCGTALESHRHRRSRSHLTVGIRRRIVVAAHTSSSYVPLGFVAAPPQPLHLVVVRVSGGCCHARAPRDPQPRACIWVPLSRAFLRGRSPSALLKNEP